MQVLIYSFLPIGQLLVRIFYLKGSLDKLWLMFPILLMPPFSFIPLILIKLGFVQDGKGSDPIDKIMILPLIARIITLIVLNKLNMYSSGMFILINLLINIFTIFIANMTRRYYNCDAEGITINSFGKAIIDSTIAYAASEATPILISKIPFVGLFISVLKFILGLFTRNSNIIDGLFSNMGFAISYILINMFNQDDLNKFCNTPFTGNYTDKIPFIISIIAIIIIKIYELIFG